MTRHVPTDVTSATGYTAAEYSSDRTPYKEGVHLVDGQTRSLGQLHGRRRRQLHASCSKPKFAMEAHNETSESIHNNAVHIIAAVISTQPMIHDKLSVCAGVGSG